MAVEVTLGGNRLGSGNKQTVKMHDYQMSSFNLEQDFKSSMAPGVLYPFIKMVATNHGTFDIDLDSFVRTLPTKGPLFGSYKLQIDLFEVPIRLYQGILHNNPTKIGMKMNQVYLPKLLVKTEESANMPMVEGSNKYTRHISNNSLLKYLGISGIGTINGDGTVTEIQRKFNAVPILAYYDIFKNYYSNKQEENAYVLMPGTIEEASVIKRIIQGDKPGYEPIADYEPYTNEPFTLNINDNWSFNFTVFIDLPKEYNSIMEYIQDQNLYLKNNINEIIIDENCILAINLIENNTYQVAVKIDNNARSKQDAIDTLTGEEGEEEATAYFENIAESNKYTTDIHLEPFALQNIDDMRNALLSSNALGDEFVIGGTDWTASSGTDGTGLPYSTLFTQTTEGINYNAFKMNGLVVKTYQSDLFNNWLDTEWIDGEEGIAALTAISTSGGSFTMDSFVFAEKLYDIYNRIATGGGTYEDWQEAVYGEGAIRKAETPMYIGGMAAEVMFEEVISNSETKVDDDFQPLGSLGGKGTQVGKRGGNNIHVKCNEPSYIIGIASLTPRICYSQGNDWDMTELETLDDLHKPGLDGIGFQDLIVEQMAWWNTRFNAQSGDLGGMTRDSAGKQTAWINYQTAIDKCYGDFADQDGYSFMVLNRNYEMGTTNPWDVKDITTYIDPKKYNYAFAVSNLSSQNFWVQIHSRVIARRKMGAQQIPNL